MGGFVFFVNRDISVFRSMVAICLVWWSVATTKVEGECREMGMVPKSTAHVVARRTVLMLRKNLARQSSWWSMQAKVNWGEKMCNRNLCFLQCFISHLLQNRGVFLFQIFHQNLSGPKDLIFKLLAMQALPIIPYPLYQVMNSTSLLESFILCLWLAVCERL